MQKFYIGQAVHVDTDNKQWGRVACDGEIIDVIGRDQYLISASQIMANIIVPVADISGRENFSRVDGNDARQFGG